MYGYQPRGFQKGKNCENQKAPILDLVGTPLKAMFDAIVQVPPQPLVTRSRPAPTLTGIAQYTGLFETTPPPPPPAFVTPKELKQRQQERLRKAHEEKNEVLAAEFDPFSNPKATENAFLTMFVGRLSFDTTEKKLKREFEQFGAIRSARVVCDDDGKSRGYAFVEFVNEKDMQSALRRCEGRKIDGRRVIVDVERGRTVRGWRPTRLGGGLGGRVSRQDRAQKEDRLREEARGSSRDRERERERERERRPERSRERERERERGDSRARRGNSRDRMRSRSRDRGDRGERDRDRDRERRAGRSRERERERERGRSRDAPRGSYYGDPRAMMRGDERERDRDRGERRDSRSRR